MRATDLKLADLLDFAPEDGRLSLRGQRMLLWDADAFGHLRKELIDRLGVAAARGILVRFGFASGYRDAQTTRDLVPWPSATEWWLACPALQASEGKVRPQVERLEIDRARGEMIVEVRWHGSYEAAQHRRAVGTASVPACWTVAGYASGFSTAVLGAEVFVVEEACAAAGADACRVVGRSRAGWGADADRIAADYAAPRPAPPPPAADPMLDEIVPLDELERRYTLRILARNRGSRVATARALGIGTNTLWRRLKRWGVGAGRP